MREGKLFRMEFDPERDAHRSVLAGGPKLVRRVEHFWLCGPCSATLTLVMSDGKVLTSPIEPVVFRRAAAS
jgi:hypothetical protein